MVLTICKCTRGDSNVELRIGTIWSNAKGENGAGGLKGEEMAVAAGKIEEKINTVCENIRTFALADV